MRIALLLGIISIATGMVDGQQFVDVSTTRLPDSNEYSSQVAIADIDGDGDLDLAFANGSGFSSAQQMQRVRIMINDGSGTFTDETIARVGNLMGYGRDVEFGDVDNDGDLDLAVANDFLSQQRLLINDGQGFFSDETASLFPAMNISSSHCSFGDVDNDGDLDLWFTRGGSSRFGAGQAQLWINDGTGFYTNETNQRLPQQLVSEPMDSIFGDLDGDFDLDLVEGHRAGNSKLYLNDGSGTFIDGTSGRLPADSNTYSYDLGDLDGDGDLDLFGVNSQPGSSREAIFINDGSADFTNLTTTYLPNSSNPSIDDNDSKFFDIDNDGDLDVIIASLGSTERILLNAGGGFLSLIGGTITAVSDSSLDVEVGDLDGDGDLDVVTAQGESGQFRNRLFFNNGPADTLPPTFVQIEQLADTEDLTGPYPVRVVIGDGMTSDHGAFFQETMLRWQVDGGPLEEASLRWSGLDMYRGEIPAQTVGSSVTYSFRAIDFAGNEAISQENSFQVTQPPILFVRGECNGDGDVNIADAVQLLVYLFGNSPTPGCLDACDSNDDGTIDVSDPITLLSHLFTAGGPLPEPAGACGEDLTPDPLECTPGASGLCL